MGPASHNARPDQRIDPGHRALLRLRVRNCIRRSLEVFGVAATDKHTGAFVGQRFGASEPSGAGHKRTAVLQTEIHWGSLSGPGINATRCRISRMAACARRLPTRHAPVGALASSGFQRDRPAGERIDAIGKRPAPRSIARRAALQSRPRAGRRTITSTRSTNTGDNPTGFRGTYPGRRSWRQS
jgi:hypothetical protein